MLSRLRKQLGTAGLVVAIVALIAALAGGAFAASKVIITSKNQISSKVRNELKGNQGAPGAPGAPGTAGANGKDGTNGTSGTSATTESFVGALHGCTEGGVVVKSASPEVPVCNGKKGIQGIPGPPGVIHPGETLPSGASETGTWGLFATAAETFTTPLSFPIPLAGELAAADVEYLDKGATPTANCPGSAASPEAEPGKLCVYTGEHLGAAYSPAGGVIYNPSKAFAGFPKGAAPAGANLQIVVEEAGLAYGAWAVTAP